VRADVAALAAKEVVFEPFEAEQGDEFVDEGVGHLSFDTIGSASIAADQKD
jgi:hypothetical protein